MKKCIVLDLDNTLWGGVIGEDGMGGIQLGLTPPGSDFVAFQQALLDLHHRGVLLAINSKNNEVDALAVIREHPDMVLKDRHFAARRINWKSKVENLKELAQELNISLDSMVFFDDNPANRLEVQDGLPEVTVPDWPSDSSELVKFLNTLPYFSSATITDEDKMRGNLYVTERLRKEYEKKFTSRENFLHSLRTEVHVYCDDSSCLPRLAQLIEKTNQFNTNKRLLTEVELETYIADHNYAVFHARANDRFGDHGVIAFALVKKGPEAWTIESLLLSCRVLGRGVEEAFLESLRRATKQAGVSTLEIVFTPTDKNQPAREFIKRYFTDLRLMTTQSSLLPGQITLHYHE